MLCLDSYIKEVKKQNINLHEKRISSQFLDKILRDLDIFEEKTREICYPLGFNAIRKYYSRFFFNISDFSAIQDYVCRRENIEIAYNVLKELGYKQVENPFIIEVKCGDGKEVILNSCPEEKVFLKKENSLENYITIFPENAKYYKIKGKQIVEENIILPENPVTFTILYKLYRYNKKDFTDLMFLILESPEVFEEMKEFDIKNFVLKYSKAAGIEEKILVDNLYKNLNNLYDNLEKIRNYYEIVKKGCCYSLESFGISFSNKYFSIYLLLLFLNKKEKIFLGYEQIKRILEIIKKVENK